MTAEIVPMPRGEQSTEKARLIQEAKQQLDRATALDERKDDLSDEELVGWYDTTIPFVKDIKILSGAMEIELARRRGERILQEGERRGRPEKGSRRDPFSEADRIQRIKDRAIAREPEAVRTYVQREATAGRVPSQRGALREAKKAHSEKNAPRPAAPKAETFEQRTHEKVRQLIEKVKDRPLLASELAQIWNVHVDNVRSRLELTACYGTVKEDGDRFIVSFKPGTIELDEFKRALHQEVVRRRKEAFDGYHAWRPDNVHTLNQSILLDWLEDQLQVPEAK